MTPVIKVENIAKCYRIGHRASAQHRTLRESISSALRYFLQPPDLLEDFWALQEISFEIMPGETVGMIGPNGAGKSTLLKILSRIIKPTRGLATIQGKVGSLLEVGTGFHPELTGYENIFLSGAILGMPRSEIKKRFDEIIAFAEADKFLDTPVKRYSSGMYVRLGFAVAACLNPNILIIDEVLAVGDARFQRKCFQKLKQLSAEGVMILFVSHNLGAVGESCQRCLLFENGHLTDDGKSKDIIQKYLRQTSPIIDGAIKIKSDSKALKSALFLDTVLINQGHPICHGEPLEIIISFEILSAQADVSLGFAFSTLEGTRIFTCDSDLENSRLSFSKPGMYSIKAQIPRFHLAPGMYALDIGARYCDFTTLDYKPACAQVSVLPGGQTPNFVLHGDPGLRIPCHWSQVHLIDNAKIN